MCVRVRKVCKVEPGHISFEYHSSPLNYPLQSGLELNWMWLGNQITRTQSDIFNLSSTKVLLYDKKTERWLADIGRGKDCKQAETETDIHSGRVTDLEGKQIIKEKITTACSMFLNL